MKILYTNRGWLRPAAWELYDKDVCLEHVNISCMSGYDMVVYIFNKNAKILYIW